MEAAEKQGLDVMEPPSPMEEEELPAATMLTPVEWLQRFSSGEEALFQLLGSLYGAPAKTGEGAAQTEEDRLRAALLQERVERYSNTLEAFVEAFPYLKGSPVMIVRCPARVNLRGMHIDSHGGSCNALAVSKETMVIVCPTAASGDAAARHVFTFKNTDPFFPPLHLDLSTPSTEPEAGWGKYVEGTLLALKERTGVTPNGFTALVSSDIPKGAGISSSHSLVLSIAHSCLLVNKDTLRLSPVALIELARLAEGKAGAVTGLGDQGAMKYARCGAIVHASFFQEDHQAIKPVVVDSRVRRNLSGKEAANYAVPRFAYSIGLGLLKEIMQESGYSAEFTENVDRLSRFSQQMFSKHGGSAAIYKLLQQIPEQITLMELKERYPSLVSVIARAEQNYLIKLPESARPATLQLRGALLFGIAECARARRFFELWREAMAQHDAGHNESFLGLLSKAGKLMNIGHAGDSLQQDAAITDEYLDCLIKHLEEDANDEEAQLEYQPGAFRASTPELDEIQRILQQSGCIGASLTGAGLGGVVVGVAPCSAVEEIKQSVHQLYFAKSGKAEPQEEPYFHVSFPVAGLAALTLPSSCNK
ncbi:hypothetical protein QOT17_010757 [Balamuthia mandrillaris]